MKISRLIATAGLTVGCAAGIAFGAAAPAAADNTTCLTFPEFGLPQYGNDCGVPADPAAPTVVCAPFTIPVIGSNCVAVPPDNDYLPPIVDND